jgi:ABC-type uncharacterized transport system substrate-binding protein
MRRREFILLVGGAAATWPLAARAQEPSGVRRIGVLMNISDDPEGKARLAAFRQSLEQLGWIDGRNVRIDTKWADGDVERIRRLATEMVGQSPDVILATGSAAAAPLLQATRTVPIVFVNTQIPSEPVMSKALRDRAATLPAFYFLNTALVQNGWTFLSRLHRK